MNNIVLGIPIKYRINNALKRIPKEYGIEPNSKLLNVLKSKSFANVEDSFGHIKKFPDINTIRYNKAEVDPIFLIYHKLWHIHDIQKLTYVDFKIISELTIVEKGEKGKTNILKVRNYGNTKKFKIPSSSLELKDWNYVKAIKQSKVVDEKDVALYASIRAVKDKTGIDVTKIPNYIERIKFMTKQEINGYLNYKFILHITTFEYNKHIVKILDNPTDEFFNSINPEISEIKYRVSKVIEDDSDDE